MKASFLVGEGRTSHVMESTPLIRPGDQPNTRFTFTSRFHVLAAITMFAGIATLYVHSEGVDSVIDFTEEPTVLSFTHENYYTKLQGKHPGKGYPWLKYGTLVEPHRDTTLLSKLSKKDRSVSHGEVSWLFEQRTNIQNKSPQRETHSGENVVVVFKNLGDYHLTLNVQSTEGEVLQVEETLVCLYIRRELRTLSSDDVNAFMSSIKLMSSLSRDDGRQQFGADYNSLSHYVGVHLMNAADRSCDHMHDGMGFITQHIALTSQFEATLQAIDPSTTVPYWDYTYDKYQVDIGNISNIWESKMWHPDYFGTVSEGFNTVRTGRWAYTEVSLNESYPITNAYGYMRAPWNVNKSPYITRVKALCGAKDWDSWPSCQTHYDVTFSGYYDVWYNYVWGSAYAPHGPVHVLIGGYANCEKQLDEMADEISLDNSSLTTLKNSVITYLKGAWRSGLIEAPTCSWDTPQDDCTMKCTSEPSEDGGYLSALKQYITSRANATWLNKLNHMDQMKTVTTILCGIPYISGDQLEAGSPVDPSFWPIHPTIDRLLQYKHMVNEFSYQGWDNPDGSTQMCSDGNGCLGHNAYDITPFQSKVKDKQGNYVMMHLTNAQLYEFAHPTNYSLSYGYDNFDWEHCDAQGFTFVEPPSN